MTTTKLTNQLRTTLWNGTGEKIVVIQEWLIGSSVVKNVEFSAYMEGNSRDSKLVNGSFDNQRMMWETLESIEEFMNTFKPKGCEQLLEVWEAASNAAMNWWWGDC